MIKSILRGMIIGIANIIPGVSGGTMSVSMGIYDKLIHAVTHLKSDFKNSFKFLLPILIGVGIGIVFLSFLIEYLFLKIPIQTNLLFIGLISGGLPAILKNVDNKGFKVSYLISFVLFFLVVVLLALMGDKNGNDVVLSISVKNGFNIFIVGIIASATMVIPGVSGSMILMLMGYYEPIIEMINRFIRAVISLDIKNAVECLIVLLPFGIGVILGIVIIAKLIDFIFNKFTYLAYWAIIGLIFASPIAIIFTNDFSGINFSVLATSIIAFIVGFFVAYKLGD